MIDSATLLRRCIEQHSQAALAELVCRHLNLVYFVALRQASGATTIAEDAAQATFTLLAQKAAHFPPIQISSAGCTPPRAITPAT